VKPDDALEAIDDLMDAGTALVIRASRLDGDLSDQIHRHLLAWRSLAITIGDIPEDGLDAFNRHLRRQGE
jgi:hypothetical protein